MWEQAGTLHMKLRTLTFILTALFAVGSLQSCIDKDIRKSQKVAKQRAKAKRSHSTRHRNHKKLAH